MKRLMYFVVISLTLGNGFSLKAQTKDNRSQTETAQKVEAYYFHLTSRCVTCKAVESEAKKNLETLYPGKIVFQSLNLEDSENGTLVKKLDISGQTLLIVLGEKKINLTNEGFLYARNNPARFKSIIKERVDRLISQ